MKLSEVEIGNRYWIRIRGALTIVTVKHLDNSNYRLASRTRFVGVNVRTGRDLRFTAAKLRGKVSNDQYTRFISTGVLGASK